MKPRPATPFQLLLRLFKGRFVENDAVSPEGGFETNFYQSLGLLATPGIVLTLFSMPSFMQLALQPPGPDVVWSIRLHRLFPVAYAFAATLFVTVFQWDTIFPDRRDFLILAPFPFRLRELFAAKFAALGLYLLAVVVAVNLFFTVAIPLFSFGIPQVRDAGALRVVAAQIAATGGASLFAFFAVAACQGVLIGLTSPSAFRRISPFMQMLGMSLAVLTLLLFPLYAGLFRSIAAAHPKWLWFFPPYWFCGVYDLLSPHSDPLFAALGCFAMQATAAAAATFVIAWTVGFRRHYHKTLEAEDTSARVQPSIRAERLIGPPQERAIFAFTGRILARSTKHKLFLATYLSVGISVGLLVLVDFRRLPIRISLEGLRVLPFIFIFFAVSGLRAAFQLPAELASNWIFRITEAQWAEVSRRATRKQAFRSGLLPVLLLFSPLEFACWGWQTGLLHCAFQLVAGALLIELLFWTFGKVPFACSYFPGRINLTILAMLYVYGFTSYSFRMADLEHAIEGNLNRALMFFSGAAVALIVLWWRHPAASAVSFDASEPCVQTLGLSD